MSAPHIDRIRNLVRSPQTTAAPPAVTAPPVVPTVATGGACQGCEDGCSFCVPLAEGICSFCDKPYRGDVTHYERGGVVFMSLHTACDVKGVRPLPTRLALALGEAGHELVYDGRWTA